MIFAQSVKDGDADRDICEFSSRVRSFFRCVCAAFTMQSIFCCSGVCSSHLLASLCRVVQLMLLASSLCLAAHNRSCNAQDLERWVYVSANFLLPAEVNRVEQLMKECRPPGYTHLLITDSKFCRLKELDKRYFRNIARIAATAKQLDLKLVPAVFPLVIPTACCPRM